MVSGINDPNPEVTVNKPILSRHATSRVRLRSIKSGNRVEPQHGRFRSLLSVARHSSGGAVILRGAGVLIGGLMMFAGPFFRRLAAAIFRHSPFTSRRPVCQSPQLTTHGRRRQFHRAALPNWLDCHNDRQKTAHFVRAQVGSPSPRSPDSRLH